MWHRALQIALNVPKRLWSTQPIWSLRSILFEHSVVHSKVPKNNWVVQIALKTLQECWMTSARTSFEATGFIWYSRNIDKGLRPLFRILDRAVYLVKSLKFPRTSESLQAMAMTAVAVRGHSCGNEVKRFKTDVHKLTPRCLHSGLPPPPLAAFVLLSIKVDLQ